jgi:hypothetical protein
MYFKLTTRSFVAPLARAKSRFVALIGVWQPNFGKLPIGGSKKLLRKGYRT